MEFIKRGRKPVQRKVHIIPRVWIHHERGKIKAQFLDEPYSDEDRQLIHNLAKNLAPAPKDWPWFTVISRGHAKTYEEAERRLSQLERDEFTFTHDSEDPAKKAARIEKRIKSKKLFVTGSTRKASKMRSLSDSDSAADSRKKKKRNFSAENSSREDDSSSSSSGDSKGRTNKKKNHMIEHTKHKNTFFPRNSTTDSNPKARQIIQNAAETSAVMKDNIRKVKGSENNPGSLESSVISAPSTFLDPTDRKTYKINRKVVNPMQTANCDNNLNENEDDDQPHNRSSIDILIKSGYTKQKFTESVLRRLDHIEFAMKQNSKKLDRLLELQMTGKMDAAQPDFISRYDLQLPLETKEEFNIFDKKLKDEKEFRDGFKSCALAFMDWKRILTRTLANILKKFVSNRLLINFIVTRKVANKELFCDTAMYQSLFDALKLLHSDKDGKDLTEKIFSTDVGAVLRGSKDWDGGRRLRQKSVLIKTNISEAGYQSSDNQGD